MIIAQLDYSGTYDEHHSTLLKYLKTMFVKVESGFQGDSWIWIYEGDEKVAIDSFSSMKHQVNAADKDSVLVKKAIEVLKQKYKVVVYEAPESEAHE